MTPRLLGRTFLALFAVLAGTALAQPSVSLQASARQADGKLLVAGNPPGAATPATIVMGRIQGDGTMDPAFGAAGWAQYGAADLLDFRVLAIAALPAGNIVVAGTWDGKVALARFDAAGAPDLAWGLQFPGLAIDPASAGFSVNALAAEPDGSVIVAGSYAIGTGVPQAALLRYLPAGTRDTGFGDGGMRLIDLAPESELRALARTATGIAASGYVRRGGEKNFLLAHILAGGQLDYGFAAGGWLEHNFFWGRDDEAFGVDVLSNGDIVVSGTDGHTPNAFLTALHFDQYGYPRASYRQFVQLEPYETSNSLAGRMAFEDGADLVLGGTVTSPTGRSQFVLARVNPGNPHGTTTFGPVVAGAADRLLAAAKLADGAMFAVGTRYAPTGATALRARYFADTLEFDSDYPTDGPDATPNALVFTPATGLAAQVSVDSNTIRVSGINVPVAIAIAGGSYSIECDGNFTTAAATVTNGQRLCLRGTSSATAFTASDVVLRLGDVDHAFRVTTGGTPETRIQFTPSEPSGPSGQIGYEVTDPALYGDNASFECALDGQPVACPTYGYYGYYNFSGLQPGTHVFQARAANTWGADATPASHSWTVVAPPKTTITSGPPAYTNSSGATFTFVADQPGATFQCRLNNGWSVACTSPFPVSGFVGGQSIRAGQNTFSITATSGSISEAPPTTYTWIVDQTAPTASIVSGPPSLTNNAQATFSFSTNDPTATFRCNLDGMGFQACSNPATFTVREGNRSLQVYAIDPAGNTSASITHGWRVDLTPPSTALSVYPSPSDPSGEGSATFGFYSWDETATVFQCRVDGQAWYACTSPATVTGLVEGNHTFEARAIDPAGNVGYPAMKSWRVDLTPPETTIGLKPAAVTRDTTATFTVSSSESGPLSCRLDGAAWASCGGSIVTYRDLAQGTHTFEARATDAVGHTDPTPASHTWVIDSTVPTIAISGGPAGTVPSSSAVFTFSSNEAGASFRCSLDAAEFGSCASPAAYSALAEGAHTFQVQAVDAAGNTSGTASRSWTVDTVAPETSLLRTPEAATPATNAQFDWAANESGTTFEYRLDGGAWVALAGTTTIYTGLAVGAHTFEVRAIDAAGNADATAAAWSWTIDQTAPDSTITSAPPLVSPSASATFAFSSEPGATFVCSIDANPMVACTSPITYTGLADGLRKFNLLARDTAGNWEQSGSVWEWTIDTSAPETTVTSGPSGTTGSTSAAFGFSATDPAAAFECSLDGGPFVTCASGIAYSGLAEGMHMFEVRARDAAGNVDSSPAARTWSVDTTAPNTSIGSGPDAVTSATDATITFSSADGGAFHCRLDLAAYAPCSSPATFAGLASGSHTFSVYAVDIAGNADPSPATWSWFVDRTAPETTLTSGPNGNNNPDTATFTFSSNEAGATFECKLDTAAFVACASGVTYAGLTRGDHAFQVRAVDAAGNRDATPATRSWKVR